MNKKIITIFVLFSLVITSTSVLGNELLKEKTNEETNSINKIGKISTQQAKILIDENFFSKIVDLRPKEEFEKAHILNSISVEYNGCLDCIEMALKLYKNKKILLYSSEGLISKFVSNYLLKKDFNSVYSLKNGFNKWVSLGYDKANSLSCGCLYGSETDDKIARYGLILDFNPSKEVTKYNSDGHPDSYDWRNAGGNWLTSVKDQGTCGSCYAFAATAAIESKLKIIQGDPNYKDRPSFGGDNNGIVDFSEQYIVSCGTSCFYNDGVRGCLGATFNGVINFIETYGIIPENYFEYDSKNFFNPNSNRFLIQPNCGGDGKDAGWSHRVFKPEFTKISPYDDEEIKSAVYNEGPVIATMIVYPSFDSYQSGEIYKPDSGESPIEDQNGNPIGHLITIVGYDDSDNCWICKNSWGKNWGENGYFKIKYGVSGINSGVGGYDYYPGLAYVEDIVSWKDHNEKYSEVFYYGGAVLDDFGRLILNFNNVEPDTHLKRSITIGNGGVTDSYLDWKVYFTPSDWVRTYEFDPEEGFDLSYDGGTVDITFDFYIPESREGETLREYFSIKNKNNCVDKRDFGVEIHVNEKSKTIDKIIDFEFLKSFQLFQRLFSNLWGAISLKI